MKTPDGRIGIVKSVALRNTLRLVAGCGLVGLLAAPAHGQFGIDTAALLAALGSLNTTMQTAMQVPMQYMQELQQDESDFVSNTIYPVAQITALQGLAKQSLSVAQQAQQLVNSATQSAKLPVNQQLESAILSRDPNQVANISALFSSSYGGIPATTSASQQTITTVDMGDAAAQESYKESVVLDALADREMEVSQQLLTQLQTTAPGNAPIVSAQASAWLLQGHGYSQAAMAQILRAQSALLGYEGSGLKQGGVANQNIGGAVTNMQGAKP